MWIVDHKFLLQWILGDTIGFKIISGRTTQTNRTSKSKIVLRTWSFEHGPTNMVLQTNMDIWKWSFENGPSNMVLRIWSFEYGPSKLTVKRSKYFWSTQSVLKLFLAEPRKPTEPQNRTLSFEHGPSNMVLRIWSFKNSPSNMVIWKWSFENGH
jgi:hypothetical protein